MHKQRSLPFGYLIVDGEIKLHEAEAECVKKIFLWYTQGQTLQQIADSLNITQIFYMPDILWDKHRVRRILQNKKYASSSELPPIIDPEIFQYATELREQKAQTPIPALSQVRSHIVCPHCFSKLYYRAAREFWECHHCDYRTNKIPTALLLQNIQNVLNQAIQNPEWIAAPYSSKNLLSLEKIRLTKRIDSMMEQETIDIEEAIHCIYLLSAETYRLCGAEDFDPQTIKIKKALYNAKVSIALNEHLFQQIVDKVILYPNGNVSFLLCNRQGLGPVAVGGPI